MKISPTPLAGLMQIQLKAFADERGFFLERFQARWLADAGINVEFVQDNHSRSAPQVLRGLHQQTGQGKLVGVTRGKVWDVAVDLRKGSATYGKYFALELSDSNHTLLWIPPGFAHGFCVLGQEPADLFYKVSTYYDAQKESGIRWNDPRIAIDWPIQNPLLSPRDTALPFLER